VFACEGKLSFNRQAEEEDANGGKRSKALH